MPTATEGSCACLAKNMLELGDEKHRRATEHVTRQPLVPFGRCGLDESLSGATAPPSSNFFLARHRQLNCP